MIGQYFVTIRSQSHRVAAFQKDRTFAILTRIESAMSRFDRESHAYLYRDMPLSGRRQADDHCIRKRTTTTDAEYSLGAIDSF